MSFPGVVVGQTGVVAFHGPAGETPPETQAEKSHVGAVGWVLKPQRAVGWSQRAWVQTLALPYRLRDLSAAALAIWPQVPHPQH